MCGYLVGQVWLSFEFVMYDYIVGQIWLSCELAVCDHLASKSSGTLPRVMNEHYAGEHHRSHNTRVTECERAKVKVRERDMM